MEEDELGWAGLRSGARPGTILQGGGTSLDWCRGEGGGEEGGENTEQTERRGRKQS